MAPRNADFERAAIWRLSVPDHALDGLSDAFLQIGYVGDVAHLSVGQHLLDDDFYKGTPWEIGLKRFLRKASSLTMTLEIMPLRKDAPIYIQRDIRYSWPGETAIAKVNAIVISPEYELRVEFRGPIRPDESRQQRSSKPKSN